MPQHNETLAKANKKSVKLAELAAFMAKQNIDNSNYDRWQGMRDILTGLDEMFFRSGKIDKRGDFLDMCGYERE